MTDELTRLKRENERLRDLVPPALRGGRDARPEWLLTGDWRLPELPPRPDEVVLVWLQRGGYGLARWSGESWTCEPARWPREGFHGVVAWHRLPAALVPGGTDVD